MGNDFNLNNLPTNTIYSESEDTKKARHKYYKTRTKTTFIQIIPSLLLVLGIIFLISFLSNINNNLKNESYSLLYIAITLFIIAIISFGIIKTIINNILEPLIQDIQRSIVNDQLSLTGANVNISTRKSNNTNSRIQSEKEKEIQELKTKIANLTKDLSDEKEMQTTITEQSNLIKKYESIIKKLESEVEKLQKVVLSYNTNNKKEEISNINPIKLKQHKKSTKHKILLGIVIILSAIFITTLILLIRSIIAQQLSIGLIITNAIIPILIVTLLMFM